MNSRRKKNKSKARAQTSDKVNDIFDSPPLAAQPQNFQALRNPVQLDDAQPQDSLPRHMIPHQRPSWASCLGKARLSQQPCYPTPTEKPSKTSYTESVLPWNGWDPPSEVVTVAEVAADKQLWKVETETMDNELVERIRKILREEKREEDGEHCGQWS